MLFVFVCLCVCLLSLFCFFPLPLLHFFGLKKWEGLSLCVESIRFLCALCNLKSTRLLWRLSGKEFVLQCRRHGFSPMSGKTSHTLEQLSPLTTTAESVLQSLGAATTEPMRCSCCGLHAYSLWGSATPQLGSGPCSPRLEENPHSSQDPTQPLNKWNYKRGKKSINWIVSKSKTGKKKKHWKACYFPLNLTPQLFPCIPTKGPVIIALEYGMNNFSFNLAKMVYYPMQF